jgi:Na+-translocating ferredoxin:NAD+ oxidoreductase subunit B
MSLASIALWGIAIFTVIGLIFGVALAATARRFHVASDPVIDDVYACLPAANCGACGFPGCRSYAEAVVAQADVSPALCIPGGQAAANEIAPLTGKTAKEVTPVGAVLNCYGTTEFAKFEAEYKGVKTCEAAALVFGGAKACKHGCLGFGDCSRVCAFDAISVGKNGIAVIDPVKCTGCGKCVGVCPKHVLQLLPANHRVQVSCSTTDKGSKVRSICSVGCISCRKCVKVCPAQAVYFDGRILIDQGKCVAYGPGCNEACVEGCPTGIFIKTGVFPTGAKRKEKATAAE